MPTTGQTRLGIVEEAARNHELTNVRVLHRGGVAISVGAQDLPLLIHSIRKSVISALYGPLIDGGVGEIAGPTLAGARCGQEITAHNVTPGPGPGFCHAVAR